jgi:glycosyltransferase involved in cell wall biosynthesis
MVGGVATSSVPGLTFAGPAQRGLATVIIPVYNGERFVRESLDSILGQAYRPLEVLVLDDASTDRTPEILGEYEGRIVVHRAARNIGQFANVNRGLALARGEYIAVFHADDVYEPGILEESIAALAGESAAGASFCADRFLDEAGREYGRLRLPEPFAGGGTFGHDVIVDQLLRRRNTFLRTPGAVVRRRMYEQLGGFRTDFASAGDFEMWLRISRHAAVIVLDRHLYGYRHTPGSEGNAYQRSRLEPDLFYRVMDEYLDEAGTDRIAAAALDAYRAHRAEDLLLLAARAYAMDRRYDFKALLGGVRVLDLVRSPAVARGRLLTLWAALTAVSPLPTLSLVRRLIAMRWHVPTEGAGA